MPNLYLGTHNFFCFFCHPFRLPQDSTKKYVQFLIKNLPRRLNIVFIKWCYMELSPTHPFNQFGLWITPRSCHMSELNIGKVQLSQSFSSVSSYAEFLIVQRRIERWSLWIRMQTSVEKRTWWFRSDIRRNQVSHHRQVQYCSFYNLRVKTC